jgi:ubiquinone biosynthesis protein Coq4
MWNELRIAISALRLYRDPSRLGEVTSIAGRLVGTPELARFGEHVCEVSPAAAAALRERYMIRWDLAALAQCPEGSLGRSVADHCAKWKLDPGTFPVRPTRTPTEYGLAHIENTHDVWHPVCGFDSDTLGEVGLQALIMAQFPNRLGALILALAFAQAVLRNPFSYTRLMEEITRGWLIGKRAAPLFGVRWDMMWDRPLDDVRRELGVDVDGVRAVMAPGTCSLAARLPAVA